MYLDMSLESKEAELKIERKMILNAATTKGASYHGSCLNHSGVEQRRLKIFKVLRVVGKTFVATVLFYYFLIWLNAWYINYKTLRFPEQTTDDGLVDFDDIIPSEKLEWHPCFAWEPAFKCARLTVPMDYHRPLNESKDNPKVHIALVLVPGKHGGSQSHSVSPMLLNPGGPGGSGVSTALSLGEYIQQVVGEDQDVIGFDPRGIGATTPRTDCFSYPIGWPSIQSNDNGTGGGEDYAKGHFNRLLWMTAGRQIGNANSSSGSLEMLDARSKAQSKLCQDKDATMGNDSIFKYVNTPNVVRDMVTIIDAWDEWTDSQSCSTMNSEDLTKEDNLDHIDSSLSIKGKLIYWGFSYGTLLGATFAAMFPDRVGRVILDGVVDADHYVAPVWMDSIRDADAIWNSFPYYCHKAKEECRLYRSGDKITDVNDRFFGTLENLKANPITFSDPTTKTPVVITYSQIRQIAFSILYEPMFGFYSLAQFVDMIIQEDYTMFAALFSLPGVFRAFPNPGCEKPLPAYAYPNEAQSAIMCSDKRYPLNETIENLKVMLDTMLNVSSWADVWLTVMLGCEGWGIEARDPPMRWDDHPAHKQKPIKTSFPILFISNTYDPVTPLYAGVQMAKKFVGAGLIEQKSMGHCSVSAVSKCTIAKIKSYIIEGVVPPVPKEGGKGKELENGEWDRCEADEWPFHPYTGDSVLGSGVRVEEAEAMKAMKEMQKIFAEMKHWGQPQALHYSAMNI